MEIQKHRDAIVGKEKAFRLQNLAIPLRQYVYLHFEVQNPSAYACFLAASLMSPSQNFSDPPFFFSDPTFEWIISSTDLGLPNS